MPKKSHRKPTINNGKNQINEEILGQKREENETKTARVLTEVEIVGRGIFVGGGSDGMSNEAKNGADPQQHSEAAEELFAELDPLGGGLGRAKGVGAVTRHHLCVTRHRQTRLQIRLRGERKKH